MPVGAIVSTVIDVLAEVLWLPAASRALALILFEPCCMAVKVHDQVVPVGYVTDPTVAVEHVTTTAVASVVFVPVIVCEVLFVGDVTVLIVG